MRNVINERALKLMAFFFDELIKLQKCAFIPQSPSHTNNSHNKFTWSTKKMNKKTQWINGFSWKWWNNEFVNPETYFIFSSIIIFTVVFRLCFLSSHLENKERKVNERIFFPPKVSQLFTCYLTFTCTPRLHFCALLFLSTNKAA